jgi:hypothetical protein
MSAIKALRLDDRNVKSAMNHPLLKDKKPIGRGVFSAVFEGTRKNTVLKMTVDDISYCLLNDCTVGVKHRHFPRVIENHGDIGAARINWMHYPIYLYEVERLEKLKNGSDTKRLARMISKSQDKAHRRNSIYRLDDYTKAHIELTVMARDAMLPRSIRNALSLLSDFCSNMPGSVLDMHLGNFMQRKNGELVITDPLASAEIMNKASAQLSRRGW